jgi:xanthine/uracil/vitamin C permease (AzgA family)
MAPRVIYLGLAAIVFLIEVAIAQGQVKLPGLSASFIRGSLGDVLVIVLVYLAIRGSVAWAPATATIAAIGLGFIVEGLQFFHLADLIGLKKGSVARLVLGSTFSWEDLLMYLLGGYCALALDRRYLARRVAH